MHNARHILSSVRQYSSHRASVYIHWPYCAKRCSYCNFNKYISQNIPHKRITKCLNKEIETLVKLSGVDEISSVFFGGGTPSLAAPESIHSIIDTIRNVAKVENDIEISMEGNPTSMETKSLQGFKDAGVNRFSIGLQALNDEDLHTLARNHSVEEALESIAEAQKLFPGKTSLDVIFGRPNQNLNDWIKELKKVVELSDGHLSLYQLTLERGTALFKLAKDNKIEIPSNDTMADMYNEAIKILENAELMRYEVSNFSIKGAESKHNLSYWNLDEYIGIGPGAHGRFCNRLNGADNRSARIQTLEPDNWMYEVEHFGHGTRKIIPLSTLDLLEEFIAVGLRLTSGIHEHNWKKYSPDDTLHDIFYESKVYNKFNELGLLEFSPDKSNLRATSDGILILDSILPDIICHLQDLNDTRKKSNQSLQCSHILPEKLN